MLRFFIATTLLALCVSCAKPPLQKLDAAEYMLKRAQLMEAGEFAQTEYRAAHTALSEAKRAIDNTDYRDAEDSLEFSLLHSMRAIRLTKEGKARRAAEEKVRQAAEEKARQEAQKAAEEEKRRKEQTQKAVIKPTTAPAPKVTPVANYDVRDGETLWTISALPQVYNEGLLWPLLYQANRDQIKDPRQIFPGQTLSIRRDMTKEELEEARQTARESDIFPVQ